MVIADWIREEWPAAFAAGAFGAKTSGFFSGFIVEWSLSSRSARREAWESTVAHASAESISDESNETRNRFSQDEIPAPPFSTDLCHHYRPFPDGVVASRGNSSGRFY